MPHDLLIDCPCLSVLIGIPICATASASTLACEEYLDNSEDTNSGDLKIDLDVVLRIAPKK